MPTITALDVLDIRFPTSRSLDGSDAMNPDPDYSAAYVIVRTDAGDGLEGHGLTFTIGRGTEVVVAGVRALRRAVAQVRLVDAGAVVAGLLAVIAHRAGAAALVRLVRALRTAVAGLLERDAAVIGALELDLRADARLGIVAGVGAREGDAQEQRREDGAHHAPSLSRYAPSTPWGG